MSHEYPSISNSSKAPKQPCIVFDKLDGNNVRVKYTQKKGFYLYGTRTQLFDVSAPEWAPVITLFEKNYKAPLEKLISKHYANEREITAFLEFYGDNSFAGVHQPGDEPKLVLFDLLVGHKQPQFLLPQEFIKFCGDKVEIPRVLYKGNLGPALIADVRAGKFPVKEGVICKGTTRSDYAFGGVWMAKIKTQAYLDIIFNRYGAEGMLKYGE